MKGKRMLVLVMAVMFVFMLVSVAAAEQAPSGSQQKVKASTRTLPKFNTIKGTVYISEQPDWNKAANCNCDCIEVIVSKQTGTSGGQIKIPTYAEVTKVKAKGGKVAASGKCTYTATVPGDSLTNLSVGAKYTGTFNPKLVTGGGGITAHPLNLAPPFSMVSGGTVVYDMKLQIDYIK